ncbi:MAG: hypothetical protein RIT81_03425 [Deltaproteobacteria bacterium]
MRLHREDFALAAVVLGTAASFSLDDPRRRFLAHLVAMAIAGVGWVLLARGEGRRPQAALVAGALLRIWAIALAPAFSDDVFRYVFEGRVVWSEGLGFPFAHAPAEAPALGVDPALLDRAWLRINHPELATIYPPFAQAVFALAGGLAALTGTYALYWLKALLVIADGATTAILHRVAGPRAAIAWWLCPIGLVEVAREGHADGLSALGLAVAVFGFAKLRPTAGYGGLVLAALAKLNGLVALPAALRATRRGTWVLAGLALLAVPFLLAGSHAGEGLGAYASRWRAGDGLFTVLLEVAEVGLGGDWRRFGAVTLTRHQVARGLTAVLFGGVMVVSLRRRVALEAVPERAGTLIFALLLLAPTFHPWYVLWLVPFALAAPGFRFAPAVLWLVVTAPLLHHPSWLELVEGRWTDLGWVRFVVHAPALALTGWVLVRRQRVG